MAKKGIKVLPKNRGRNIFLREAVKESNIFLSQKKFLCSLDLKIFTLILFLIKKNNWL